MQVIIIFIFVGKKRKQFYRECYIRKNRLFLTVLFKNLFHKKGPFKKLFIIKNDSLQSSFHNEHEFT